MPKFVEVLDFCITYANNWGCDQIILTVRDSNTYRLDFSNTTTGQRGHWLVSIRPFSILVRKENCTQCGAKTPGECLDVGMALVDHKWIFHARLENREVKPYWFCGEGCFDRFLSKGG